jgi:hypothetical protein
MTRRVELIEVTMKCPNHCFRCYRVFLSTFSCVFSRPENATFLLAAVEKAGLSKGGEWRTPGLHTHAQTSKGLASGITLLEIVFYIVIVHDDIKSVIVVIVVES